MLFCDPVHRAFYDLGFIAMFGPNETVALQDPTTGLFVSSPHPFGTNSWSGIDDATWFQSEEYALEFAVAHNEGQLDQPVGSPE